MARSKLLILLHNNVERNGKVYAVDITSLIVCEKMARLIAVHITTSIVWEKMPRLKLLTLLY